LEFDFWIVIPEPDKKTAHSSWRDLCCSSLCQGDDFTIAEQKIRNYLEMQNREAKNMNSFLKSWLTRQ